MSGVDDAFAEFDEGLRVSGDERRQVLDLRVHVAASLNRVPSVQRLVDVGSFSHGTEVRGRSRFDVLVVLGGSRPKSLTRALDLLREAAPDDLPAARVSRSGDSVLVDAVLDDAVLGDAVRGDPLQGDAVLGDAVQGDLVHGDAVRGGGAASGHGVGVRLIPAFESVSGTGSGGGSGGASGVVVLPDAARRLVESRPGARAVLLDRIDGGTVRALIRLMLAWKYQNGVAVSSYYLETAVIRHVLQQPSFSVLWDVCWVLEQLAVDDLMNLPDLTSPSQTQRVRAAASLARRIEAQFLLDAGARSVRTAVNAYLDDDVEGVARGLVDAFGPSFSTL